MRASMTERRLVSFADGDLINTGWPWVAGRPARSKLLWCHVQLIATDLSSVLWCPGVRPSSATALFGISPCTACPRCMITSVAYQPMALFCQPVKMFYMHAAAPRTSLTRQRCELQPRFSHPCNRFMRLVPAAPSCPWNARGSADAQ